MCQIERPPRQVCDPSTVYGDVLAGACASIQLVGDPATNQPSPDKNFWMFSVSPSVAQAFALVGSKYPDHGRCLPYTQQDNHMFCCDGWYSGMQFFRSTRFKPRQNTYRMLQLVHELGELHLVVPHQDGVGHHYQAHPEQQRLENGPCPSMTDN